MNTPQPLPAYAGGILAAYSTDQLLELLAHDEDRVPRNVIDECARRGDAMVAALRSLLDQGSGWEDENTAGQWWRLLHAAMILGLIPTEAAGLLLVQYMRRMSEQDDDALQDWLSVHWPALFGNKPASLMSALRTLCEDRNFDFYIRACATDALVAMAQRTDSATLDDMLTHLAATARDETEDWDYRLLTANTLLDFPRPQYRELLETLAKQQPRIGAFFHQDNVEKSYAEAKDKPNRGRHYKEPWAFYEPQAITARQERWAEEDREAMERAARGEPEDTDDEDYEFTEPYVRDLPKIGRNDPCPCGSGKKFKKCCLPKYENLP